MNKKSIRKLIALFCTAAILSLSLAACGSSNNNGGSGQKDNQSSGNSGQSTTQPSATGTGQSTGGTSNGASGQSPSPKASPASNVIGGSGAIIGAKSGTYTASAKGYSSDVSVVVKVDESGTVKSIKVDASGETESIGQAAAPKIADQVVKNQNFDVDAVTGATYTCTAVLTAIKDALAQAGVDPAAVHD